MGYMGIEIVSPEMRRNTQVMLSGRVEDLKALIVQCGNLVLPIALVNWDGISSINSYQLAYALYDTYAYNPDQTWFKEHHIMDMLNVHKSMCPYNSHVDYSKIEFLSWNDWEYYDENDIETLLKSGVRQCDINLANYGMQHKEKEVIELLQKGASPYYKDISNDEYIDKDGVEHWCYANLAAMPCQLYSTWCDQWNYHGMSELESNMDNLDDEELCRYLCYLFNAAASMRMLYIIDKYIKDDVREKGMELLKRYDAYYPILRYKPEYEDR
jgi:hypothetical protein